jgi:hypothetical protein
LRSCANNGFTMIGDMDEMGAGVLGIGHRSENAANDRS